MHTYEALIDDLQERGYLSTPEIIEAFRKTPRKDFLPQSKKSLDGLNSPLPIGHDQTISQPLTVGFMIELLQPRAGDTVLEIGYGSGWQSAILARIICPEEGDTKGTLHAYEIVPELATFGESNIRRSLPEAVLKHVHLYSADYTPSCTAHAPYDRIISAAAFTSMPDELIQSLQTGGILVYPTQANDIRKITKEKQDTYTEELFPGFVFVPITHAV